MGAGYVKWADLDQDGDLDILIGGDSMSGAVSKIFRNNGDGTFTDSSAALTALSFAGTVCDLNNDGKLDIVLAGRTTGNNYYTTVYRNNGNETYTDMSAGLRGIAYSMIDCADYDRDGKNDIVVIGGCIVETGNGCTGYAHSTFHNEGNFIFSEQTNQLAGTMLGGVAFGDYNLDGYPDIALSGFFNISSVYDNNQTYFSQNMHAGLVGVKESSLAWADYDNDGELELIVAGMTIGSERSTILYDNEAVYTFTPTPTATSTPPATATPTTTSTVTPTRTPTLAPTLTSTPSPTSTKYPTATPTGTPTDKPEEPGLYGSITGTAMLGDGDNPVEGVRIRITGALEDSVETDEDGEFAFSELPYGSYQVIPDDDSYTYTPSKASVELSEEENVVDVSFAAKKKAQPDLVVNKVINPARGESGKFINVVVTVENKGHASSGNFTVVLFIATDNKASTPLNFFHKRAFKSLEPGKKINKPLKVELPANLHATKYYIGAFADPNNLVPEERENNNLRISTKGLQIKESMPRESGNGQNK